MCHINFYIWPGATVSSDVLVQVVKLAFAKGMVFEECDFWIVQLSF